MQIINYKLPGDDCNLFLFGCTHTGNLLHHEDGWNEMVEMLNMPYDGINAKYNVAADHGDTIDAIVTDDKRFDIRIAKNKSIDEQIKEAIRIRKPIKNKLITILKGNHEHTITRFTDAADRVAEGLGVVYGTWSAVINYIDKKGNIAFKHFLTHGTGSISSVADDPVRQKANKELSVKRKLKSKFGDCMLNTIAHFHQLLIVKPEPVLYLTSTGNKIKQNYTSPKDSDYIEPNHKFYACVGSFLKMYELGIDTYSERGGYDPVELGFIICKIRNRTVADLVRVTL